MFDLYLITPERSADDILALCGASLMGARPGRVGVQLRAMHLPARELHALAHALRRLTREHDAALLVSADLMLADAIGADGVQLPEAGPSPADARRALGTDILIGASRHDRTGIEAAHREGADFATLSPVLAVTGKGRPLGIEGVGSFGEVARACALPLLALGGLGVEHVPALKAAGAHGIAIIREVSEAPDPADAMRALLAALDLASSASESAPRDSR